MKKIRFRKYCDSQNRTKRISISSRIDDSQSKTLVYKRFFYKVSKAQDKSPKTEAPQIHIIKGFDTVKKVETFNFKVNGKFYMTHGRVLVQVDFQHELSIKIIWNNKHFSPKKSEVLT